MNDYLVFYQDSDQDETRDFVEVRALDEDEAENKILVCLPNKNIISIWEKVKP